MFPLIDLDDAASRRWDMVIAGSSFAAMFFLRGLPEGLSVLVVEKGAIQSHDEQLADDIAGQERFVQENSSGREKLWIAQSTFGGNSNCWWAVTPRFHPSDFEMQSRYRVAEDWPFGYAELEPYYEEVERIMEVSGGGSDHILPRRMPFPYPPHLPSRTDRILRESSPDWFAQPTARANGGRRATCCANGVCRICPIDSKFTIVNSVDLFERDGVALLTGAELRAVRVRNGHAEAVAVRQGRNTAEIACGSAALGANAVFNAAILLRSGLDLPGIGKGLNEQASKILVVDAAGFGPFGSTSITGHGYPLYDGPHRAEHSGVLIEVYNAPTPVRPETGRWLERAHLKLIVEDLPQDANRVVLEGDEPKILWAGHHRYMLDGLGWGVDRLTRSIPKIEDALVSALTPTEAHMLGTHRMGADTERHVVDESLRCHAAKNLFVLGGGAFPSSSIANPTLTISALSLRAARGLT